MEARGGALTTRLHSHNRSHFPSCCEHTPSGVSMLLLGWLQAGVVHRQQCTAPVENAQVHVLCARHALRVLQRIPDRLIHYRLYIGRLEYVALGVVNDRVRAGRVAFAVRLIPAEIPRRSVAAAEIRPGKDLCRGTKSRAGSPDVPLRTLCCQQLLCVCVCVCMCVSANGCNAPSIVPAAGRARRSW